jgi:predicted AAA+ superfamily ATPase
MKRKIYNRMLNWKQHWQGRTALLIDGARRIGKSWIVTEFAKQEYKSYIVIDFNNVSPMVIELFEQYLIDLDTFFSRLSLYTGVKLYERKSAIIFDEVQMYPKARAAIKYLVADGRYDFIETGSLVSINHNVRDIVIPSEEVRINMYPMDFEEFMWALGKADLYDFLVEQCRTLHPIGQILHRQVMEDLRTYLLVGGMPQAVLSYLNTKDFRDVDAVKRTIIALYRNDISKYAGGQAPNVTRLFDSIPGLLQQHEKRLLPSRVKPGARMRDFDKAISWLDESRVVNFCYAATEPSVALALNQDNAKVKMYMADTGLLMSMAFSDGEMEQGGIYEKILRGKLEFNKGMMTENLVAQMLRASGHPLYFYSSKSNTDAADRMEIDFLIRKSVITSRHNISPIEVKSSGNYTTWSLDKFRRKFDKNIDTCYVLHSGDLKIENGVTYLPLYMAGMI